MDTTDLCQLPSGISPNGVYNFDNPTTLAPAVISVGVTLGLISTVFCVGRIHANRKKMHAADYFTILACLVNIAYTGVICAGYKFHRHSWDIPVCWYTGTALKLPFVQTVLFSPAFFFSKAAILLLYRQLFVIQRGRRIAINIGLTITLLNYLSNIPLAAVYAAPRAGQSWDSLLLTLQANTHPFALAGSVQSAVGTVIDIYIFVLPLPILWKLHLPLRRRIQLVATFSTALLGVAASVVSLIFKIQILSSTDAAWLGALTSMCCLIETNIAIIVGCVPAFAHFAGKTIWGSSFFRSLRSRFLRNSGGQPGSSKSGASSNLKAKGGPIT